MGSLSWCGDGLGFLLFAHDLLAVCWGCAPGLPLVPGSPLCPPSLLPDCLDGGAFTVSLQQSLAALHTLQELPTLSLLILKTHLVDILRISCWDFNGDCTKSIHHVRKG